MTGSLMALICSTMGLEMGNEYSGAMQALWKTSGFRVWKNQVCMPVPATAMLADAWKEKGHVFLPHILRRGFFVGSSVYSYSETCQWNSCLRRAGRRGVSHCLSPK